MTNRRVAILALVVAGASMASVHAQSRVVLTNKRDLFQLSVNGKPFSIKGVGGDTHLDKFKAAGGNVIRTWASDDLERILDEAQKHRLMVCAGLWMGHQRHGFNYQDQAAVLKQLEEKLDYVRKYKDHPALLMWAVGNEAEGAGTDPSVWYAINHLAREIKAIDRNHPTMTVIAELGENASKIRSIGRFCPDIDIIGINSYGGIESVAKRYRQAMVRKPYIITEHGTLGPWEVGKTSWGSPIEWSSTEKAAFYANGYRKNVTAHSDICLGTFAFIWGHKQETTATWFGMLLPDGTKLGAVDAMTEVWSKKAPKNRCPKIESVKTDPTGSVKPGTVINATVSASDPEGDKLTYKWLLLSDAGEIGEGGDPQSDESTIEGVVKANGNKATVTMPKEGGGYRLFVYIYDGQGGAAVANVPLHVAAPIAMKNTMPISPLPYAVFADGAKPSVYVPSGYMGNAGSISMDDKCSTKPHSGDTCLKAEYKSGEEWGGVLWQSPAEDWDGNKPGGANLTGATKLEFWARGENGGEVVNFVFGVLDGNQPYRDTAKGELPKVQLTKDWKKYSFSLKDKDLRRIKTGFGWSLAGQGKPVTFYLDDIRYVK